MGYKSPITVIQEQVTMNMENEIFKAIQKVNVEVDREELLKALNYDRDQYFNGYTCGYFDGRKEMVEKFTNELLLFIHGETFRKGYELEKMESKIKELAASLVRDADLVEEKEND